MKSLLDLTQQVADLKKRLTSTKDVDARNLLETMIRLTEKAIAEWGTKENTIYQIC